METFSLSYLIFSISVIERTQKILLEKNEKTILQKITRTNFSCLREKEEEEGAKIDQKIDQKIYRSIASKFDASPTINQLVVDPHITDDDKNLRPNNKPNEPTHTRTGAPNNPPLIKIQVLKQNIFFIQHPITRAPKLSSFSSSLCGISSKLTELLE